MGLFGKKKPKTAQPAGQAPMMPSPTNAPGQMSAPKGTLAQNLGLDRDLGKLPPLPGVSPRDSAPGKMDALPPLPPAVKKAPSVKVDLPPLPSTSLPPLPSGPSPSPLGPAKAKKPAAPERAPVFIRLDKYQEILDTVNQMESRINNLQNAIKKIGDIKSKEQDIISNWTALLTEARQKVNNVNSSLPETK